MRPRSKTDLDTIPTLTIALELPRLRRHLMTLLGAHGWNVRSHETGAGVLNDPQTLSAAILLASDALPDLNAPLLVSILRSKGWQGKAILAHACPGAGTTSCSPPVGFSAAFDPTDANHLIVELVKTQFSKSHPEGDVMS